MTRTELLSLVDSSRFVRPIPEFERCTPIPAAERAQEQSQQLGMALQVGVQRLFVGNTAYPVMSAPNQPQVCIPYTVSYVVRTTVVVTRGCRRHYVGVAPSWWLWTRPYYGWGWGYGYGYGWGYGYYGGWGGYRYHHRRSYFHHHHRPSAFRHHHTTGGFGRSHHSGFSS